MQNISDKRREKKRERKQTEDFELEKSSPSQIDSATSEMVNLISNFFPFLTLLEILFLIFKKHLLNY